jgi:glycosyltransferase involved in cell wall biosynthesis
MFPAVPARVIPNGIDVALFQPGDGPTPARERLALPPEAFIVAYTGHSPFKDSQTAEHAFATLPKHPQQELIFIQLGVEGPAARIGAGRRLRAGMVRDPSRLVDYYRAADVFVHAAHAEAFGKTATEAMACGTPVVATAVGGLIEQIEDGRSGLLTPPGDAAALAAALAKLWSDPAMRSQIGRHGADNARIRFSLERQAHAVLDWHKEVIAAWRHGQ